MEETTSIVEENMVQVCDKTLCSSTNKKMLQKATANTQAITSLRGCHRHGTGQYTHYHNHHPHRQSISLAIPPRRLAMIFVRRLPGSCPPCTGAGIRQPGAQIVHGAFRLRARKEHQKATFITGSWQARHGQKGQPPAVSGSLEPATMF